MLQHNAIQHNGTVQWWCCWCSPWQDYKLSNQEEKEKFANQIYKLFICFENRKINLKICLQFREEKKKNLIKLLQFWDADATTQVVGSATTSIVNNLGFSSQSECNMSGLILYHWMPGVHTHSPNTGSLCYMGLECLTTMSGGDQESNEHIFWIQTLSIPILRGKTAHSTHTFSMYYLYFGVSLLCGVRMSACHV